MTNLKQKGTTKHPRISDEGVHLKYVKTRERNRLHAQKSRERQKNLICALKQDLCTVQTEFNRLKGLLDHCNFNTLPNLDVEGDGEINILADKAVEIFALEADYSFPSTAKPNTNQVDAHSLRKERNRIHAKKTRDRKKNFINNANLVIVRLGTKISRVVEALSASRISFEVDQYAINVIKQAESATEDEKEQTKLLSNTSELRKRKCCNETSRSKNASKLQAVYELPTDLESTALLLSQLKSAQIKHDAGNHINASHETIEHFTGKIIFVSKDSQCIDETSESFQSTWPCSYTNALYSR